MDSDTNNLDKINETTPTMDGLNNVVSDSNVTPIDNNIISSNEVTTEPSIVSENNEVQQVESTEQQTNDEIVNNATQNDESTEVKEENQTELDEEALKKKKKKQMTILILVIASIIAAYSIYYILNKKSNIYYDVVETELTESTAEKIVKEKVEEVINVYEKQTSTFSVKESTESDYLIATNYDSVVKEIFSENGIKELEKMTFNKKKFVVKKDDSVSLLKELPEKNRFSNCNITVSNVKIEDQITATVTLTTYAMKDDILNYYVFVKNMKLIKDGDNWLVESFDYLNE